jgi:hypothetical protein
MTCYKKFKTRKRERKEGNKKGKTRKNDLIYEQYTNAGKLGVN